MIKRIRQVTLGLLWLIMMSGVAQGQTNVIAPSTTDWSGRVVVPDQPTTVDSINTASQLQRPLRLEQNRLPPEVRDRIEIFKWYARKYLEQQELLKRKLQGATDEERARIREQLRQLRNQWLERSRELRREFKDRQRELIDKLPGHREVLENARDAAREQLRDQIRDTRDRGGQN